MPFIINLTINEYLRLSCTLGEDRAQRVLLTKPACTYFPLVYW